MELEPHLGHVIVCDRDTQGAARIFCVSCVEALVPETRVMTMPLTILEEEEEVPELCAYCEENPRVGDAELCQSCFDDDNIQSCEHCGQWMDTSSTECATGQHCDCCSCDCFKCDKCGGEFSDVDDYGSDGLCQTCWDDAAKICGFCEQSHHEEGELCVECANDDNLLQCPACDTWFLKENGVEAEEDLYCSAACAS